MKPKKATKKPTPGPRRTERAPKVAPPALEGPDSMLQADPVVAGPVHTWNAAAEVEPPAPATKPPAPMTRSRLLTPAAKRGAELVRYLRIHAKSPYGPRGQKAIYVMAREVARLGLQQLEEVAASQ